MELLTLNVRGITWELKKVQQFRLTICHVTATGKSVRRFVAHRNREGQLITRKAGAVQQYPAAEHLPPSVIKQLGEFLPQQPSSAT